MLHDEQQFRDQIRRDRERADHLLTSLRLAQKIDAARAKEAADALDKIKENINRQYRHPSEVEICPE